MPVRTIAVVLGDNDFADTFYSLLDTVHRAITWDKELSKEVLEEAIRAGLTFHYQTFQLGNRLGRPGYPSPTTVGEYLQKVRVLFDEEAEADIARADHDSGAWYLEVATGQVRSY